VMSTPICANHLGDRSRFAYQSQNDCLRQIQTRLGFRRQRDQAWLQRWASDISNFGISCPLGELPRAKMSVHNKSDRIMQIGYLGDRIITSPVCHCCPGLTELVLSASHTGTSAVFESRVNRLSLPDWILNNLLHTIPQLLQ